MRIRKRQKKIPLSKYNFLSCCAYLKYFFEEQTIEDYNASYKQIHQEEMKNLYNHITVRMLDGQERLHVWRNRSIAC